MTNANLTTIHAAAESDASTLANLIELYSHELSAIYPNVNIGEDGRFGYKKLPLYWSEPETRLPFLIRNDGKLAGFVLVRRGAHDSPDTESFDVAEFFILMGYRGYGVARKAAFTLWNELRGRWTVRVYSGNIRAMDFWSRTLTDFAVEKPAAVANYADADNWRTFTFTSAA